MMMTMEMKVVTQLLLTMAMMVATIAGPWPIDRLLHATWTEIFDAEHLACLTVTTRLTMTLGC